MKITKNTLKQLIKEELENITEDLTGPAIDPRLRRQSVKAELKTAAAEKRIASAEKSIAIVKRMIEAAKQNKDWDRLGGIEGRKVQGMLTKAASRLSAAAKAIAEVADYSKGPDVESEYVPRRGPGRGDPR